MNRSLVSVTGACLLIGTGCASLATVPGRCGSGSQSAICLGTMSVPATQTDIFSLSSQQAIDALYSQAFVDDLARFHRAHAGTGAHSSAWAGVEVGTTVDRLRRAVHGIEIKTYGGMRGWWVNFWFGNVAYDGATDGPIYLNRWALPRSSASIANTIAHEVGHRVGLTHPSSNSDLDIARCEPPYVIGSLVEKQIEGAAWKAGEDDCSLLESRSTG